jgi:hypothetical protein
MHAEPSGGSVVLDASPPVDASPPPDSSSPLATDWGPQLAAASRKNRHRRSITAMESSLSFASTWFPKCVANDQPW